ncbi:putative Outer membrane porin [Pseudoalteromonas luteoviolacea B = ATCC 29581]|nr:putative Outer membrane porin [Pseudoalteromonas luteoviolacea B = ATCC 29581]
MTKFSVVCAVSTILFSQSLFASDMVNVYGRVHIGVQNMDDGQSSTVSAESYASRLGFKGDGKLTDGVSAFYKFEFEVKPTENENDGKSAENITARSQYVGVKGGFGELLVGRNDTPMKQSQNSLDLMNDFTADISSLMAGENRLGDTIHYTTPALAHLRFEVAYIAKDNSKQSGETGLSVAATYGDDKLKDTPVFVSVARDEEVAGRDTSRVTLQGKLGDLTLSGMYQQSEKVGSDNKENSFVISAAYKISSYKLLAQYQDSESDAGKMKDSGTASSIGVEKSISKQVRMYLWYSQFDLDNKPDQDHMALTLRYDF